GRERSMSEASPVTISISSEEEVRAIALWRRLREHNYRIVGKYPEAQNVWLNANDLEGNFLGGLRGEVHFSTGSSQTFSSLKRRKEARESAAACSAKARPTRGNWVQLAPAWTPSTGKPRPFISSTDTENC